MNGKSTARHNFNWIAPIYDALALAVFGKRLQHAQTVFIDQIPANVVILIVGGGTGWLLEQILIHCRPEHVVYLDTSWRMVDLASRRMLRRGILGSVDFRVGNETLLNANDQFDVVLTPFVLDLFTEQTLQSQFIPALRTVLKPGGLWISTDFVKTNVWWQQMLLWSMIRFFRLTAGIKVRKLADWQRMLSEAGLIRQKHQQRAGGMVSAELWMNPA